MRIAWDGIMTLGLMLIGGCSSDERLVTLSQKSMETQRQQNEVIARQSNQVVQESSKLAETARELVVADAKARGDTIGAHQSLQRGVERERQEVSVQRDKLEDERRALAQ